MGRDPRGQPITRTEWVPDPELAEHVVELFERLANGDSVTSIARDFTQAGVPSPSGKPYWTKTTVYDLARRVYVHEGTRVWNMVKKRTVRLPNGRTVRRFELKDPRLWIRVENAYPRIIPPELARRVRERFPLQYDSPERYYRQQARRPRRDTSRQPADGVAGPARNSEWVLTGLAVCGYCGGRLVGYKHNRKRKDGTVWRAYRCGTYVRSGKAACRSYYIPAERLEAAVLEALRVAFEQGVTKEYAERVARALRRAALKRLRQLEQRLARIEDEIVQAVQQGIRNELDRDACNMLIGRLKAEAQQLFVERSVGEQFIEALEGAGDRLEELIREGLSLVADWPDMSPQERAAALREVVESVVVFPEEKMATVYLKKVLPELPKEAVVKIPDRENAQKSSGSGEGNVNHSNGSGGAYPLVCLTFEAVEVNWATGEVRVA